MIPIPDLPGVALSPMAAAPALADADPGAAQRFAAAMQAAQEETATAAEEDPTAEPDTPPATDEELALLPDPEIAALRQRLKDDYEFRVEAKLFLEVREGISDSVVINIIKDGIDRVKGKKDF